MLTKHSNTERMKRSAELAYLKEYYPQNLVQFHKIGVKLQNAPENENEVVVEPDVHFQIDGKEYLVFFNNHLREINTVLNRWLEIEFSEHGFIMPDIIKMSVKRVAEKGKTDNIVIGFLKGAGIGLIPGYGLYQGIRGWGCNIFPTLVSSKAKENEDRIYRLAHHVYKTKELIEKYGSEIQSGKICAICIEKSFNGKSEYITDCDNELYQDVEAILYKIMSSYEKSKDEKLNDLNRFLYGCEKKIQPTVDEIRRMEFCFVINRVNSYLTREEELLSDKSYEELKTMTNLRRRLNQLAIKYKHLYLTNTQILLGIRISRCKILVDNRKCKTIFIESSNVREFYKKINKRLDAEVQILTNKYSFSEIPIEKIIETAQSLNLDNIQDSIDKLKKEINEKKEEREKLLGNAATEVGKVIIQKVEDISDIAVSIYNIGSLIQQFNKKENTNPPKIETNSKENTNSNEEQKDVKKENTNPPKTETNSKENKEIIQSSNTNKQINSLHSLALNNTSLGIALKVIKPTPEQLDKLHSSFNNFVEAQKLTYEIESFKEQLSVLEKVQELSNDFINLLKLNIELQREWLFDEIDINEYLGIIVTEDNRYVVNPRTNSERKSNHKIYEIEKVLNYNEGNEEY
ncbi:hypothetical protein CL6EHI_051190 [Entamoeba histolytica]|uniref:Uncharacterized protein n=2 Tax=Entamoeba histolytica TaxID=5759 RepID=B1N5F1_ENTH1|nr:hypothetical protein EHI_051190 [Entamoeba histolytica HM-1:IMSS]EDS88807.1 hypothetical protein EHI_051190 [Entamoeba histolytica HM-1:IMSS]GAT99463.1 hypothetical protein CL6EHI_051190 [Entamoeba histolytica]|eukprot:XP_001914417.1 hypothetical protein EHI_051190 [Entamoeba histolytica HM-1:IMSS]